MSTAFRKVTWVSVATDNPMGQQHYEAEIQRALIALDESDFDFRALPITSLRSALSARRTPRGLLHNADLGLARAIGGATYRTGGLVHRLDLRLPPHLGPEVVTAHDLPPLRFDDEGVLPRSVAEGARRARCVITPSAFAAQEMMDLLGVERTVVIPYGLSELFVAPQPATNGQMQRLGIAGPFLLHAAGASARKNLAGLAKAWQIVSSQQEDILLVLCGPQDPRRDLHFEDLPRVVKLGRVPAQLVAGLMCRSEAVVVPSVYEGFGLPALEGMACGAPVVAAARGALPEVCGDAAVLVEPDGEALAEGILQVLGDPVKQQRYKLSGPIHAANFSWERAAQKHLEVYRSAWS